MFKRSEGFEMFEMFKGFEEFEMFEMFEMFEKLPVPERSRRGNVNFPNNF